MPFCWLKLYKSYLICFFSVLGPYLYYSGFWHVYEYGYPVTNINVDKWFKWYLYDTALLNISKTFKISHFQSFIDLFEKNEF